MKQEKSSLAKTTSTIFLSLMLAGFLTQAVSIIVARMVSIADLGIFAIIVSIQNALGVVAAFGMRIALAKYIAEHKSDNPSIAREYAKVGFLTVVIVAGLCMAVYVCLANPIAYRLYDEPHLAALVPLSGLVVFFTAVHSTIFGIAQGYGRTWNMVVLQIVPPVLLVALVILLVPGLGIEGVLLAYVFSKVFASSISIIMLRKSGLDFFREPVRISTSRFRELMSIAMPSLLSTAVVMPVLWIGNTELIVEQGFNAMGLLAIALFFFNVLQIVPQSIVIPLIPHISSLQKTRPGAGGSTSIELVKLTSIFIVPTILVASVYKDWIITFLFGEAYGPAGEATALLLIAGYFASMASVVGAMMAGIGRMWLSLSANVVWAASFLLLVFLLVPPYGLTGIGLAFAASYGIHLTAYFALARLACQISFGSSYMLTVVGTLIVTCGLVVTSDGLNAGIPAMTIYVLLGTMTIVALGWRTLDDTILRRFIRRR